MALWRRGAEAQYHRDGEWLSYVVLGEIFMEAIDGRSSRVPISAGGQARWSRDGTRIYYLSPDRKLMEVPVEVRKGHASAGTPRPLFQTRVVAPTFAFFQYDVRDARPPEFIVNSLRPEAPLTIVSDWTALLPR